MGLRGIISSERGAAAAEMALIAPVAVLILFTTLEAAHYFYAEHQVVKGLRDGARYAARQSFDDINCRNGTPSIIPNDLQTDIKNLTRTGKIDGGSARVSGWIDADITLSVTCPTSTEAESGLFDSGEPAPQVNIATTLNYDSLFNGLGIVTDSAVLTGTQQATVMGI